MTTIGMLGERHMNRVSGVTDEIFWSFSLEASVRSVPTTSLGFDLGWGGRKDGH